MANRQRPAVIPDPMPLGPGPAWQWWLAAVVVFAAAVIVYWPTLQNEFISWDDKDYLVKNTKLTQPGGLARIWDPTGPQNQFYPMVFSSFWLEHYAEQWFRARNLGVPIEELPDTERRFNPAIYHGTNLVLHALTTALLVWFLRLLGVRPWVAWLTAGLFAVHPINVASVAWAAERKNVLSGLFFLLAMIAYLRFTRRPRWYTYAGCLLLFILALLSKSATVTLPAVVVISDRLIHGRWLRRSFLAVLPMLALGAAAAYTTAHIEQENRKDKAGVHLLDRQWRPLAAAGATWFYVGKVIVPTHFPGVYTRWDIPANVPILLTALFALLLVAWGLWHWRRKLPAHVIWALAFYALVLSPMLGLKQFNYLQYTFVADHFVYLPVIGLFLVLAIGLDWIRARLSALPNTTVVLTGVAVVLLASLGLRSYRQNERVWRNSRVFWEYTIRHNPTCWPGLYNLANVYRGEARVLTQDQQKDAARRMLEQAADLYKRAAAVKAELHMAHRAAGDTYRSLRDFESAAGQYRLALERLDPRGRSSTEARYRQSLAECHYQLRRADEAEQEFLAVLKIRPSSKKQGPQVRHYQAEAAWGLGRLARSRGRLEEAIAHFEQALQLSPKHRRARQALQATQEALQRSGSPES